MFHCNLNCNNIRGYIIPGPSCSLNWANLITQSVDTSGRGSPTSDKLNSFYCRTNVCQSGGYRRTMWLSLDSIFSSSTAPLSHFYSQHRILFWNRSGNSIRMEQRPTQLLLRGIAILCFIYSLTSMRLYVFSTMAVLK